MKETSTTPTPSEIWKILKDSARQQKEIGQQMKVMEEKRERDRENFEKYLKTMEEKRNRELKAMEEKTDRDLRKTRGFFEGQWGLLVESLVEGKLLELLNEKEIEVAHLSQRVTARYKTESGEEKNKEFDLIAVNGSEVVAVEVKTNLSPKDVRYFIDSLKDFKNYFRDYKHKKIYGAVAFLRSHSEAHVFSEKQGLFVIRATGDSASLINKKNFKPKAFA